MPISIRGPRPRTGLSIFSFSPYATGKRGLRDTLQHRGSSDPIEYMRGGPPSENPFAGSTMTEPDLAVEPNLVPAHYPPAQRDDRQAINPEQKRINPGGVGVRETGQNQIYRRALMQLEEERENYIKLMGLDQEGRLR